MAYEGPHPFPVASGGTGNSSATAYAVLCGGTTSTAALQSIAGVGTSAQVLTSNGAGALPTFQSIFTSGTWTPTLDGASSGTTTYTSQLGNYIHIGSLVLITFKVVITAATGTGNAQIGGLPFAVNAGGTTYNGACSMVSTNWAWPSSRTSVAVIGQPGNSFLLLETCGSSQGQSAIQMTNAGVTVFGTLVYSS